MKQIELFQINLKKKIQAVNVTAVICYVYLGDIRG